MTKQQYITTGVIGLALYLIATGLSFAGFSYFNRAKAAPVSNAATSGTGKQGHFIIDPSIPRTEPCPLNGKLYTKQERDVWVKRRPLAVMVEHHADARPVS